MAAFLLGVPGKLKTLLGRISADRASRLDEITVTRMGRLDINVASRATQLSVNESLVNLSDLLQRLTEARGNNLDYLDAPISGIGGGGSVIKSVQRGVLHAGGVDGPYTATIAAVDVNKAVLVFNVRTMSGEFRVQWMGGEITDATTLTFTRDSPTQHARSAHVFWQVIEYE